MIPCERDSTTPPTFSIVIPVYNDWISLDQCLQSLGKQSNSPSFEVIVVDDGSTESTPESIRNSVQEYQLTAIWQSHAGIPAARNHGIRASKGEVVLFVDADCRLRSNCLAILSEAIARAPLHDCFQLRLLGNRSSLVGRAEELRLMALQEHTLQPDGRIRYLNTAGFAIRRARTVETDLFDPTALRAEDTLLLVNLMQRGELPLFVPEAIVEHTIQLSLLACLRKDAQSAYLERRAYAIIAAKGVRIRATQRERLRLLLAMWKTAGERSIGRLAWITLVFRQTLQRMISSVYECLGVGLKPQVTRQAGTDLNRRSE
jgi:glycosyltransferase involved in cell wall biosynthesis